MSVGESSGSTTSLYAVSDDNFHEQSVVCVFCSLTEHRWIGRRDLISKAGAVVAAAFAGCTGVGGGSANNDDSGQDNVVTVGSSGGGDGQIQEQTPERERVCTEAEIEDVEWDYTVINSEDKDTAITQVTNYADVGGEITLEITVWGTKDYEDLLDTEPRTRHIGAKSTETFELKFYPSEGIESIRVEVTEQACTYR